MLFGLGSENHKEGHPQKGAWYEPTGRIWYITTCLCHLRWGRGQGMRYFPSRREIQAQVETGSILPVGEPHCLRYSPCYGCSSRPHHILKSFVPRNPIQVVFLATAVAFPSNVVLGGSGRSASSLDVRVQLA